MEKEIKKPDEDPGDDDLRALVDASGYGLRQVIELALDLRGAYRAARMKGMRKAESFISACIRAKETAMEAKKAEETAKLAYSTAENLMSDGRKEIKLELDHF